MLELNEINNPFPGIRPFEMDETNLFFGRDGQSDELLKRMQRTRLLAVVGTSGSGKSSLIRAGLLPALYGGLMGAAGSSWRIAILRPGGDPMGNLAIALDDPLVFGSESNSEIQTALIETTLRRSSIGLIDVTRQARMSEHENLLVVVDQFEELFRFKQSQSSDDATTFVKLLLEASAQQEIPIYIIITMRSDFLGDCSQFTGLPEAINNGQYLIPRMSRDERQSAIVGPIAVGEGQISAPLVSRLLNDVGDNPDQLPILQHALMRTWDYWSAHRLNGDPIDLDDYNAIGTMSEALSRHADEAFNELPGERSRLIAEQLFKRLTEKGADNREIRRPTPLAELCAVCQASEAEIATIIDVFRSEGRSFLMPPAGTKLISETVIDISHESLIRNWTRLQQWVDEEAQSSRTYRRLAEAAVLHREGHEGLLQDPALQIALDWFEKNHPTAAWAQRYHPEFEEAKKYLEASCEAREDALRERERQRNAELERARREREQAELHAAEQTRAARKLRALMVGMAVLFLLALATAAFAVKSRSTAVRALGDAQTERERARAAEQAAVADQNNLAKALKVKEEAEIARERAVKAEQEALKTAVQERQRAEERARAALAAQAILVRQKHEIEIAAVTNDKFREASVLVQRGQYDEAEKGFQAALTGYQQLKRDEAVADTYLGIGDAHLTSAYNSFLAAESDLSRLDSSTTLEISLGLGNYDSAANLYSQASPRKAADSLLTLGHSLLQFAALPNSKKRTENSSSQSDRSWEEELADVPELEQAGARIKLPPAFSERNDEAVEEFRAELRDKAIARFTQALNQYRASFEKTKRDLSQSKSEDERKAEIKKANDAIAEAALRTGDTYRESANEIEAAGLSEQADKAARQVANVMRSRSAAIDFYEGLLQNRQLPDSNPVPDSDLGRLLMRLAGLHYEVGNEAKANEYLARISRVYEKDSPHAKKSAVLFATADVLEGEGEVTAAAKYFSEALKQYTAEGDLAGQATTSYRLGNVYENAYRRGWSVLSWEQYEKALAAYQKTPESLQRKNIEELFHMGSQWEKTADYELALAAYRLAGKSSASSIEQAARANDQIGSILSTTGKTEEAIEAYKSALAAFEQLRSETALTEVNRISRTIAALNLALHKTPPTKSPPKP